MIYCTYYQFLPVGPNQTMGTVLNKDGNLFTMNFDFANVTLVSLKFDIKLKLNSALDIQNGSNW